MKIGILTYHRAVNYGAFLQGYSLMRRLQQDFPNAQVEIIDYDHINRQRFIKKCPLVFTYRRSIKEGVYKYIQSKVFKEALKHLNLSKSLVSASVESAERFISDNYDVVIVGSDSVFNWSDLGLPNPYFLGGVKGPHKLSYAASAHLQRYNDLDNNRYSYLENALNDFNYLGVRDVNTENFVKVFNEKKQAVHNCDPAVFLPLDFSEEKLSQKLKKHKFDFNKKTVFVMMMYSGYAKLVRKYFGNDCQIVALMDGNKDADIYLYDLSPFEWAHVFKYGTALVTDYFHATIFGLKNGIPVMSIDSSNYNKDEYISKAYDLLNFRLNLPECYVNGNLLKSDDGYDNFKIAMDNILQTFNSNRVAKSIAAEATNYDSLREELVKLM